MNSIHLKNICPNVIWYKHGGHSASWAGQKKAGSQEEATCCCDDDDDYWINEPSSD